MGAVLHTDQPAAVRGPDRLHRQSRRGQLPVLRPHVRAADRVAGAEAEDRQGLHRDDRPRAHAGARRARTCCATRTGSARIRPITSGRSSTSGPRRRSATPPAPPATPRACSTPTGRRCCTRTRPAWPTASVYRRAKRCCSSCRCSTSTAGALPYAGAMSGAKLVLPGPALDGQSVYALLQDEQVTLALGVPTVWLMLFQHVDAARRRSEAGPGAPPRGHRRLGGAARDERAVRDVVRRLRHARLGHDRDVAARHHLQPAAESTATSISPAGSTCRPSRGARSSASR